VDQATDHALTSLVDNTLKKKTNISEVVFSSSARDFQTVFVNQFTVIQQLQI